MHAWLNHLHMQALKDREEAVRNGKLTTIVFVRDKNVKGQEVCVCTYGCVCMVQVHD